MNLKKILQSGTILILVILFTSCKREEFSWGIKVGEITYSGNVVFLGERELTLLIEITPEQIVFSGKTGEISKITEKSILVLSVSDKTPYGALRRVSSIQSSGDLLKITTVEALLPDVIKEGKVNLKKRLLEKDFRVKSKAEGVKIRETDKSFDGLALTLNNFNIYENGTRSAVINGAAGITADINIGLEFESNRLKKIDHSTSLYKIDEVTFISTGAVSGTEEKTAAEFIHSPVIIDSLIFVAEIKIYCGFEGATLSSLTSGVRQDRSLLAGGQYLNTVWSDNQLSHTENFDYIKPMVTDNANIRIFTGPEIRILLFGIPVQTIKADGYFSVNAQGSVSTKWKLFSGLNGQITINKEILGIGQDHTANMIVQESEIANSEGR